MVGQMSKSSQLSLSTFGLLSFFFYFISFASAQVYHIEDDYEAAPAEVASCIKSSASWESFKESDCGLEAKAIELDGKVETKEFFALTKGPCGWGASSAPIWLVQPDRKDGKAALDCVLFTSSGIQIEVKPSTKKSNAGNSYSDFFYSPREDMGEQKVTRFRFDGNAYKAQ